MRSGITGHKNNGADGYVGLEKLLCGNDGPNGVRVEMKCKLIKGTMQLIRGVNVKVTTKDHQASRARVDGIGKGNEHFSRSLPGLV